MGFFGSASASASTSIAPGSLTDKVIIVTGGNSGLGKQSVLELVKHSPARIWLASRSEAKAQEAIDSIAASAPDVAATTIIKPLTLDLSSLASVRDAAKHILANSERLDILMLNAGIMATPAGLTKDGYEIQFGTNHVGHALLTKHLLPLLLSTAEKPGSDVRVVCLSSDGWSLHPKGGILFDTLKTQQEEIFTTTRYGQSKLANILFAKEMAKRYPQITSISIHPGVVQTNIAGPVTESYWIARVLLNTVGRFFIKSVKEGAQNQLWGATAKEVESGSHYNPVGKKDSGGLREDADLAKKLWEWTEKELEPW